MPMPAAAASQVPRRVSRRRNADLFFAHELGQCHRNGAHSTGARPAGPAVSRQALAGGRMRAASRCKSMPSGSRRKYRPSRLQPGKSGAASTAIRSRASIVAAETVFLRGHTPAEGDLPIEDRPLLGNLPYIRQLIERDIGTHPQRCMLARLPAGASVLPHMDRAPYFSKTLRVHVPVESNDQAWMICGGLAYQMKPGRGLGAQQCRHARRVECAPKSRPDPPDLRLPAGACAAGTAGPRRAGTRPADAGSRRALCDAAAGPGHRAADDRDGPLRLPAPAQVRRHVRQRVPAAIRAGRPAASATTCRAA